jgi:hypothetical protein
LDSPLNSLRLNKDNTLDIIGSPNKGNHGNIMDTCAGGYSGYPKNMLSYAERVFDDLNSWSGPLGIQ